MAARITIFVTSLLVSLLSVSAPAAAAPPSSGGSPGSGPEQEACEGRSSGDACSMPNNQMGICAAATCNRLDYSGGSPPKAIEEACIVCKPGNAAANGAADDAGGMPMLGGDGGPPANPAIEVKDPPSSASRCQVDARGSSPAGLALFAGLGLLFVRRRRP